MDAHTVKDIKVGRLTGEPRRLLREIQLQFESLTGPAARLTREERESCRERLGEELARAALDAGRALSGFEPDPDSRMMEDYRKSQALLHSIAAAALYSGGFQVVHHGCPPGAYSSDLAPSQGDGEYVTSK